MVGYIIQGSRETEQVLSVRFVQIVSMYRAARPTHSSILAVAFCTAVGSCLVTPLATSRSSRRGRFACILAKALDKPPTGSWFLLLYCVGRDTCSHAQSNAFVSVISHASSLRGVSALCCVREGRCLLASRRAMHE